MLEQVIQFIVDAVSQYGYWGVFIMMFLESTFFPIPSELVMIPAGYLAYKGEMHVVPLLLLGIAGSIGGALFNYYFARMVGRSFIVRYQKYLLIDVEILTKLEGFFAQHGHIATFTGRLIPVARHLISIPAGLARMDLKPFILYTVLGSAIWVAILIAIGYLVGHNEALIRQYKDLAGGGLALGLALVVGGYVYRHYRKRRVA